MKVTWYYSFFELNKFLQFLSQYTVFQSKYRSQEDWEYRHVEQMIE